MMRKFIATTALFGAVALSLASPAFALDCHNVSRNVSPAEYNIATTTTPLLSIDLQVPGPNFGGDVVWNVIPYLKGNWYLVDLTENTGVTYDPATGIVIDPGTVLGTDAVYWGFIPPGTFQAPFVPGSNGNYTNGQVDDLLGLAACPMARQVYHGIQSGACGQIASIYPPS